ncbi:response regulator [bacterium]|nr:response regulator [bacterium]
MKILIAEDDFLNRRILHRFLKKYGEVHTSIDGIEAVEEFEIALDKGEPYDLLCLDIMMPEMDGLEALKKIRAIEKNNNITIGKDTVKVIMTTSLCDSKSVKRSFRIGCEAYLLKPFSKESLKKELAKLGMLPKAL